jgi:guanylate kinase
MSETTSGSTGFADWPTDLYPRRRPLIFVISGPSGVGKDAIIDGLKKDDFAFHYVVTATTREKREKEIPGVHYQFLKPDEFARLRDAGELLESANVYGYEYGTPRQQVLDALGAGKDVILKIDVQGARQIKMRVPEAVFIFIGPFSLDELTRRLRGRGTESAENLQTRIDTARAELRDVRGYDYIVVNREGRLADAVAEIKAIIRAERLRVSVRDCDLG